jgi:hypothetical protein
MFNLTPGEPPDKKRTNIMTNTAKKVAPEATKEAAKGAEVKTALKVVRPEAETMQPEKPKPSVSELKLSIAERFNLVQKHDRLNDQLFDLDNFEANISNDARVRLESGTGRSYGSADPGAVKRQIQFCRESIQEQIAEVEKLLIA